MLVLNRKVGEEIRIADDITITLVDTGLGKAKIGITAPRTIPIVRKELIPGAAPAAEPAAAPSVELQTA